MTRYAINALVPSVHFFFRCRLRAKTYPAESDSIPGPISQLTGAIDQIMKHQTSESTSDIWELVKGQRQNVSQHRLGKPRAQNPSLLKAGAAKVSLRTAAGISTGLPITKGVQHLQELRQRREQGNKVKMIISLAQSVPKKNGMSSTFVVVSFAALSLLLHSLVLFKAPRHSSPRKRQRRRTHSVCPRRSRP